MQGHLSKMRAELAEQVQYYLPVGEQELHLNPLIGQSFAFEFTGNIHCRNCGKATKKSYSQGHCFVCMRKLASCDMCIMKPETCHYSEGTCREPEWGETNCMIPHYVYLANTSGLKVGITRHTQIPTRWIDQGATQALPIFEVATRQLSGLVEIELAKLVADKTNWRAMLKGDAIELDLVAERERLLPQIGDALAELAERFGLDSITALPDEAVVDLHFPVEQYPSKISSFNLDKNPLVEGELQGIKGQYLIFNNGVINIRKFGSYEVKLLES
ncbi:DUF2797 domain-containing protein [Agarivorans sp. 1_MG-2023]|uniref:DUF2797 domain-containing protein n=1 Tax=Agarivorans sp. 1_MG-2023 TaxID=3062634 RepID=UPI0026E1C605|nr:DUF2797 domain-containing protein [Agarivorans sp. 1_MG-2023]MDO6764363.1 DUF2797 domain-containing protein [Agarivorans sp. 1_MG-2023]